MLSMWHYVLDMLLGQVRELGEEDKCTEFPQVSTEHEGGAAAGMATTRDPSCCMAKLRVCNANHLAQSPAHLGWQVFANA